MAKHLVTLAAAFQTRIRGVEVKLAAGDHVLEEPQLAEARRRGLVVKASPFKDPNAVRSERAKAPAKSPAKAAKAKAAKAKA